MATRPDTLHPGKERYEEKTERDGIDVETKGRSPGCWLSCCYNDHDPLSPRSWPAREKWSMIFVLAAMTFVTSLASSMFAPAISQTMSEFDSNNPKLASLVISIYVLGLASGPLIVSPMSELYGRLWVYHITNVLFIIFTVACAVSSNVGMLIAFRFLAGAVGSAVLNIGGGTVADLFVQQERGKAMTVWTIGALLGPIAGPVAGGFLAEAYGWRWTFWVISIAASLSTFLFFIVMRETYVPVLRSPQKNPTFTHDASITEHQKNAPQKFAQAILRPLSMLVFSPVILLFSLYIALVYGYLYLLITTIPNVFTSNYDFSTGSVGLVYLGLGSGMMTSVVVFGFVSDRLLRRLASKTAEGQMKPEHRLPPLVPGAMLVPAGIILYGWSAQYKVHWAVPVLGTALLGAGLNSILMSIQTYLVDAYPLYAASALAATTVVRSVAGALLPLVGPDMYRALGLGWGSSLLGLIASAFVPVPFLFLKYGERLRTRYGCEGKQ